MEETSQPPLKLCKRCELEKPQTPEFWYVQRARDGHPKEGWQSNCRACWKEVNHENKQNRKVRKELSVENG